MDDLSIPILLVGVGMLVVVAVLVLAVARRVRVLRLPATVECALRRRSLSGEEVWSTGLLRFGTDRLRWYATLSLRPGPELVIRRSQIVDVERHRLVPLDQEAEDRYRVDVRLRDTEERQLVLDPSSAAVLTAWLEAAPTGAVLGDAD